MSILQAVIRIWIKPVLWLWALVDTVRSSFVLGKWCSHHFGSTFIDQGSWKNCECRSLLMINFCDTFLVRYATPDLTIFPCMYNVGRSGGWHMSVETTERMSIESILRNNFDKCRLSPDLACIRRIIESGCSCIRVSEWGNSSDFICISLNIYSILSPHR